MSTMRTASFEEKEHESTTLFRDYIRIASVQPDPDYYQAVDFLIDQANLATTMPQIIAACRAIDRVLLWQHYQIPLYVVDRPRTVHWDKFGKPGFEPKYWPAFPDGWWYDEALASRIEMDN